MFVAFNWCLNFKANLNSNLWKNRENRKKWKKSIPTVGPKLAHLGPTTPLLPCAACSLTRVADGWNPLLNLTLHPLSAALFPLLLSQTIRAHLSSRSLRCVASSWTHRLVILLARFVACSARSPPHAWLPNSPLISLFVRTPPRRNLIPALIYRAAPPSALSDRKHHNLGKQIEGERNLAAMGESNGGWRSGSGFRSSSVTSM